MELEKIKQLVDMMKDNDLSELEIVDGETRVMLKRGGGGHAVPQVVAMPSVVSPGGAMPINGMTPAEQVIPTAEAEPETNIVEIVSPIVGTFFAAPSPDADPFVEVGTEVEEETVVCIIEAMKVLNEVKSEIKGTVKKILVDNGQAVEYGQPLFLVEIK